MSSKKGKETRKSVKSVMNWYVKSQIQKESEILPDYGISEGIWST